MSEEIAQSHSELQQAQSDLSTVPLIQHLAPELINQGDQINQSTNNGIVALDCKSDDFKTVKDDNEMNNQSRQNDLVSAEKYNRLKRKFSALREVSNRLKPIL